MKLRLFSGLAALALGGAVLLSGCVTRTEPSVSTQIFVMDTIMSLELWEGGSQEQLNQAVEQLYQWEDLWSATDEDSEIWAADHSGGEWVTLSGDTVDLLSQALDLCRLTGGALDLTAYSAVKAWGFTTGEYRVPGEEELAALADGIDHTQVELDRDACRVRLPAGMELDLGAVAKGYAGARLAEQLREQGVTSALLELGGNIQTVGTKPDGSRWRVGIQDPNSQEGGYLAIVEVADQAVVTSGDYQRYFEQDGQTYCHIMDPATAAPADSGVDSVSIVGSDGTVCDALSTALFVMGEEKGAQFWKDHPELDFEAIFVSQDGIIAVTEGLEEHFTLADGYQDREVTVIHR